MDMLAPFQCLRPHVTATTLRPWRRVAGAMLCWVCLRQHVHRPDEVYLLAGDEVVVSKAGKHPDGLERFFSSLSGKPIPGLAFFACSLVSVQARRAFPVRVAPVVRSAAAPRTPELSRIPAMLEALLKRIAGVIPSSDVGLDGHFGHHSALQMARQSHLPLISKLRCDAALYVPYAGPSAGRGARRQYGRTVDEGNLPAYLQETTMEGPIQTRVYQAPLLHTALAPPLHVVIITQLNLRTQGRAHVILLSRDLPMEYAPLVDDDRWRFQIACHFLDAKQPWGLEDFMTMTPTGVTNAATLAWCMVNVAYHRQANGRQRDLDHSILDFKADCRGYTDVEETRKLLPEKPAPVV